MATLNTRRPVIVATPGRRPAVEAELERLGYRWRDLGTLGRWTLLAPVLQPAHGEGRRGFDSGAKI